MKKFFMQVLEANWWLRIAAIVFVLSFVALLHSPSRERLQSVFRPADREVLSTISADLFAQGKVNRIVKVRTPDNILVEIYGPLEDHGRKLIETIRINDRRDAFYHLMGQAVNLALKDMDGDRLPEIVAPTYDAQMMPHLNIFKFNKENQQFEPYQGSAD